MPFYMLPLKIFLLDGKVRRAVEVFSAVFIPLTGLALMIHPNIVLSVYIFSSTQSMVHHSLMIIVGVYIAVYQRAILNLRNFVGASIVFFVVLMIAIILNETMHMAMSDVYFNAFGISRFYDVTSPILGDIRKAVPIQYLIFCYFIIFAIGAYLMSAIYSLLFNQAIKPCITWKKTKAKPGK